MQYLSQQQLRDFFTFIRREDPTFHQLVLIGFWHGLRVSEALAVTGVDFHGGRLNSDRLKGSRSTNQVVHADDDPIFDERPILDVAG